jgi:putative transposase
MRELEKEKGLRLLLETIRKIFPYDFRNKHLKSKPMRAQVVTAIRECLKFQKLSHCLSAIGLSKSSYQRWASEVFFCEKTKGLCERRTPSQLTNDEVMVMKRLVTSKKFAHISISSLHLLAQRSGELFCSVDTWYRYIRCFEWKRHWKISKKRIQKTGIRAKKPNELWHLDVTVVNMRPGYKLYIQAVIDNFSRFVLAWLVTEKIDAKNTIETIALAKKKAQDLLGSFESTAVMMDPGTENNNGKLLNFITSKNLTRILAQVDIHYSNSMIESLFRMLKNNYLYHQRVHTLEDLTRKAAFYFREHNETIPLANHKGGRPSEVYLSSWTEDKLTQLNASKEAAFIARKNKNLQPPCGRCPSKNTHIVAEKFGSSGTEGLVSMA